jgi:GntR family transcriptional regulator
MTVNDLEARPVPLYEYVRRQISEAILAGEWPAQTVLPGEVALAAQYSVAVGTIRRALTDLVAEGLLMRRPRIGTVVTGRAPQHSLRFFYEFFRLHAADGRLLHSEAEVLSVATDVAPDDAACFAGEAVIRLHRLRRVEGARVMQERIVLPAARLPGFPMQPAAVPALLYNHLLARYAIRVTAVRESLTAQLATPEDFLHLGLDQPAAILVIDDIAFDHAGSPILTAHHRFVTDRIRYINEVR